VGWVSWHLDRGRLPHRRVLVRFDYPTLSGPGSRGWLLIERGDAEVCEKHPGGEEDLVVVVSDPVAFARWDLGELEWGDAARGGGRSRSGAPGRWPGPCPPGNAASTRPGAQLPPASQPPPPDPTNPGTLGQRADLGSEVALLGWSWGPHHQGWSWSDSPVSGRVMVAAPSSFPVVVIGAGQAGLAVSHELTTRGIEHVVLERARVGQSWRGCGTAFAWSPRTGP
jgi:hypothetical protein